VTFLSSSLVVLVSMRRTYWGQLAIGLGILLMGVPTRVRFRLGLIAAAGALMAITMLEPNALIGRLHSLLIFSDAKNPYATTNKDHADDLLDAWDVIMANPILGNGQGLTYQTKRIKTWKTTSSGVHNGPLHVWIQYGLLGLVSYALFHAHLFRWLRRQAREATDPSVRGIAHGVFASWVGAFTMSLGFSPWPYGSLQNTMLLGICCGLVASSSSVRGIRRHRQDARGRAVMPTCVAGRGSAKG
jgi:O-antigen ligase